MSLYDDLIPAVTESNDSNNVSLSSNGNSSTSLPKVSFSFNSLLQQNRLSTNKSTVSSMAPRVLLTKSKPSSKVFSQIEDVNTEIPSVKIRATPQPILRNETEHKLPFLASQSSMSHENAEITEQSSGMQSVGIVQQNQNQNFEIQQTSTKLEYNAELEGEIGQAFEIPDLYDPRYPNEFEVSEIEDERDEWREQHFYQSKNYRRKSRNSENNNSNDERDRYYGKRKRSLSPTLHQENAVYYGFEKHNEMHSDDRYAYPNTDHQQVDKQSFIKVSSGDEAYARRMAMSRR